MKIIIIDLSYPSESSFSVPSMPLVQVSKRDVDTLLDELNSLEFLPPGKTVQGDNLHESENQ